MYSQEDESWTMLVPFRVEMQCKACEAGTLEYSLTEDTISNMSEVESQMFPDSSTYRHVCNLCSNIEELESQYPRLDYLDAEDLDVAFDDSE